MTGPRCHEIASLTIGMFGRGGLPPDPGHLPDATTPGVEAQPIEPHRMVPARLRAGLARRRSRPRADPGPAVTPSAAGPTSSGPGWAGPVRTDGDGS